MVPGTQNLMLWDDHEVRNDWGRYDKVRTRGVRGSVCVCVCGGGGGAVGGRVPVGVAGMLVWYFQTGIKQETERFA